MRRPDSKKIISFVLSVLLAVVFLSGCNINININSEPKDLGPKVTCHSKVIENEEFGDIYIGVTIDEFNDMGFSFGDSVDIVFDNGTRLEDIPYYSGFYATVGQLLVCGYPGYPHPVISRNFGDPTWKEFGLNDTSTVTITLKSKGKYLETQELYSLVYSDDRTEYKADEDFANFRAIKGGALSSGHFFRSASPCDNKHCRAVITDKLARDNNIRFVLNLADNEDKYDGYTESKDYDFPYYKELYNDGNVLLLGMDANYHSDEFKQKAAKGFYEMTMQDGAVLIHCLEGKDRTGFVCALLLALSGASADEIIEDYMITYTNYYGITKENNPNRYEAIENIINSFLVYMCDANEGTDVNTLDLKTGAKDYLKEGGLDDTKIDKIEEYITR